MRTKVYVSVFVIASVAIVISQDPGSRCVAPDTGKFEPPPDIKPDNGRSKYPTKDIDDFLKKNQAVRRKVEAGKSIARFCRVQFSKPPNPFRRPIPTCPYNKKTYRIPTLVRYKGSTCIVLRPWRNRRCPYVGCQKRSCIGVVAMPNESLPCMHTNVKRISFYFWCPSLSTIIGRSVRLPQCCSCMRRTKSRC